MAAGEHAPLTDGTLYVYPTARKARAVVADRAGAEGAVLGTAVTTFPELTDRLAVELGVAADVLPPALAQIVLASVVARRRPTLAGRRGLVRDLYDVIEELEAAHLAATDTARVAGTLADGEAAARMEEIADVYAGYEAALAELGVVDRHGRTRAVVDALGDAVAAGTPPALARDVRRIVFAEIYDYSVLQFLLATSLIEAIGDAELVAFAHPENVAATRFLDRTWNRFVGAEPIADQVLPSFVRREGRDGAIAHVLRGIFAAERPPPAAPDASVRLVVAPHRYGEVEAVVRDVRGLLRGGMPPERIAVLARDMTIYRDLVADVARRFDVPIDVRRPGELLRAGAVRFVLDLWRLAADGLPRGLLGSVLDSDYAGGNAGRVARLLAQIGYVGEHVASVEECLVAARARGEPRGLREPPGLRGRLGAVRGLRTARTVRGQAGAMRRALRVLRFRPVARETEHPEVAARDAAAANALADALADLAAIDRTLGLGAVGPREMADMVAAVLGEAEGSVAAADHGVRALSVQDARGLDFDVVFVLGLDDGTFPKPQRESVLLPDWLRRQVNPIAGRVLRERLAMRAEGLPLGALLRTAKEAQLEEPFLFFLATSMAERTLVLVRPASDASGVPCVRSPYLDEVDSCFDAPLETVEVPASRLVPQGADCAEPRELLARITLDRWRGDAANARALRQALTARDAGAAARLDDVDRRVAAERARLRYFLTPGEAGGPRAALADALVGRVGAAAGLAEAVKDRRWSPTAVERLASCGFRFFAGDVLGLRALDDPSADADAREAGSLLHAAIEAVFAGSPLPAHRRARAQAVREILAARRDDLVARLSPKDQAVAEATWRRVVDAVAEVVELDATRAAKRNGRVVERTRERGFDVVLDMPGGQRRLRGRADLLEVLERPDGTLAIAVTDYKSGRDVGPLARQLDPARDLGQLAFQVPLYLAAAAAEHGGGDRSVVFEGRLVAAFAPVRHKEAARTLSGESISDVLDATSRRIADAAGGRFDVDPRACAEWCDFRTVCRYVRPPAEEGDDG